MQVYITADEELSVPLEGVNTAAMAVSMQQCTGDSYLRMNLQYNGSTLYNRVVTTNQCNRVRNRISHNFFNRRGLLV